jgi:hypothetical protein
MKPSTSTGTRRWRRPHRPQPAPRSQTRPDGAAPSADRRGGACSRKRPLDDGLLATDPGGIEPGAGTDQRRGRLPEQRAGERGRRGGVADAHLAADEQVDAGRDGTRHRIASRGQGEVQLLGAHGRLTGEIGGAWSDQRRQ